MGFLHSKSKGSISARAQLTTHHDLSSGVSNDGVAVLSSGHTTFRMRVTPDRGEPEFESQLSAWGGDANHLQSGRWTYVRYDPERPDRCDLDKDRLAKEFEPLYNGRHRVIVPKDVSDGWFKSTGAVADAPAPPEPAATSDSLVTDLSRLAELRAAGTLSDAEFAEAKARLLQQGKPE